MKKLMMIACMMLFSTAMFAEQGDMFVGAGLSYGIHTDYKNFGIGVKGQYELLTNLRADAQVDHFFKHDGISMSDINVNLQYVIPATDAINVYPLAGVAFVGHSENSFGFLSEAKVGFNIGAGAELPVNDKWKIFFDAKYQVVEDWGRFIPTLGVLVAL
ncbi:MAG: porin family protein [Bacteroidaceae bacterium]|jgi:outer membrane protein X|nr:porin family protein [Bacteroidaceae bacterium]